MMNEDFHCLDLGEKVNFIRKQGQHLVTTNFYGAAVELYQVKTHYVEIYHHPVTEKAMCVSMVSPPDIEKHLKGINITL